MPSLAAISTIAFPYKVTQEKTKACAREIFISSYPQIDRMLSAFDNTEIKTRNFCKPLEYYSSCHGFSERNVQYVKITLEYAVLAIEDCLAKAQINKEEITDIIFVSTTGLSTPSIDALIINRMKLNQNICRLPLFGLGCAGGVAGFSTACKVAKANPKALVLLVAAELCSLTFLRNDFSKSNFIGSGLFADGIAACIIAGDEINAKSYVPKTNGNVISFLASQSILYYDSFDVMGWEFQDSGFKVLFSQDIPVIITKNIKNAISSFLAKYQLKLSDIKNFIFHPGGKKVLSAYRESLNVKGDFLKYTREVMQENGNMSSPTVLYVLERYLTGGFENGYGLMLALGPGFSCEMALLQMSKN